MTTSNIEEAALALRQARSTGQAIAPISQSFGIQGLDTSYAVAEVNTQARLKAGACISGLKVGLTSKAVQQQLGVDQPDFGTLFDDMEYLNGQDIPTSRLMQPKIEAEIAFVVGRDLNGQSPSYSEFLRSLDFALPALEIVDSAIANWKITLADTVADNASCGLYVLGDQPVSVGSLSLAKLGMTMAMDGQTVSTGTGSACLGHPLRAAYWLAVTMAKRGHGLKAGQVILSGALGPMVPIAIGNHIHADIGDLGSVNCRMV
ncbi:MAG: fumarylacetoacetate hydrolase family protein [Hydrogenophaga sp.]|nr:fumarylacetoacetate hydrolase family protein [Hydrogenophaga sp.]